MKILVLAVNYWPEEAGIGPLATWRCEYLASRGHQVTVCTTFPYYPEWRVSETYRGRFWQRETYNGVNILRSWSWIPQKVSSAKRIVFEATFLVGNVMTALSAGKPDVLLVESPPLGLGLTAALLKKLWRIPFVFDVMDLQPDAAADLGMLNDGALMRLLYRIEKFSYDQAALVSTLTDGMRSRILEKSVPPEKVSLVPVRADSQLFGLKRGADGEVFRRKHSLEGKFVVLYTGNMGVKQGLDVILSAAQQSQDRPEILYLFAGDGALRKVIEDRAGALGLRNVTFLPIQPREQLFQMLAAADVCLITQLSAVADIVFPSRTATFMAAGCPIVASVNARSSVAGVLEKSRGGVVVAPEDPATLLRAIVSLYGDPRKQSEMSEAGRRFAREHWDEKIILPKLEADLMRVTSSKLDPNGMNNIPVLDFQRKVQ